MQAVTAQLAEAAEKLASMVRFDSMGLLTLITRLRDQCSPLFVTALKEEV